MNRPGKSGTAKVLTLAIACLMYASPSYAYLDPGTGSIILQSILASIAVAMGVLRLYWHRFKAFVSSLTGSSRDADDMNKQEFSQDSNTKNES